MIATILFYLLTVTAAGSGTPALASAPTAPAPAAAILDTIVTLPEVRVKRARADGDARRRHPTASVSDLRAGLGGRALESVGELLSQAAGVRVIQYGGLGAYSTVSLRGAPAGHVSVFLDGTPLTSAAHGVVNLSDLPATALERVEVYRGASPLGLGPALPGGAINLVTIASPERLDARLVRGSFDTWEGRATAGLRRGALRGVLHAGYQGSAGDFRYQDDNGTPFEAADDELSVRANNRFDATAAHAALAFEPGSGLRVAARQELFRKAQGVPGLGAVPAYNANLAFHRSVTRLEAASAPRRLVPGARLAGSLTRENTRSRDTEGRLGLGYHDTDDDFAGEEATLALESPRWTRTLTVEATGSLREERADLRDAADGRPDPPRSRRATSGAALALQLRPLGERVVLHAARRWDRIEDRLNALTPLGRLQRTAVTRETNAPQLGARVAFPAGLEANANWSRAERVPDFVELFGNAGSVLGNPTLKPERGETWDAGARWGGATRGGLSGAVEWSHFESLTGDLILYVRNSQSSVRAQNVSRARIRGDELTLRAGAPFGLTASAALTWQQARDLGPVPAYEGKRLPQRAERQTHARIEYRRRGLRLGADLDHLGDNYLDRYNQRRAPSRTLAGAALSLALPGERLRLTVEGKNLGDRRVSDVGGYPLPGRSLFVSLEAQLHRH